MIWWRVLTLLAGWSVADLSCGGHSAYLGLVMHRHRTSCVDLYVLCVTCCLGLEMETTRLRFCQLEIKSSKRDSQKESTFSDRFQNGSDNVERNIRVR
jgi:hypothetical protein